MLGRNPDPSNAGHHLPAESNRKRSSEGSVVLWWRVRCAEAPLPRALHAHLRLLAQSGRALVRDHHPAGDPAGQLLQRQGTDRQNRAVRGRLQQEQGPVQLDGDSRLNPGEAPATVLANLLDGTLAFIVIKSSVLKVEVDCRERVKKINAVAVADQSYRSGG